MYQAQKMVLVDMIVTKEENMARDFPLSSCKLAKHLQLGKEQNCFPANMDVDIVMDNMYCIIV